MNVYAAHEMDVLEVFEAVAPVAGPTNDPASAAPVFALPTIIIIRGKSGSIHIE